MLYVEPKHTHKKNNNKKKKGKHEGNEGKRKGEKESIHKYVKINVKSSH